MIIPADPAYSRTFTSLDFHAAGGTADVDLLIDLSKPSQTIVQKKPEYSNISGGLGIFSSVTIDTFSTTLSAPNYTNLVNALADHQFH